MIYLDNAATSFPRPEEVLVEMDRVNRTMSVNAGRGSYKMAWEAADIISQTRQRLEGLFNCSDNADIILTPSVTHAFNQILNGLDVTAATVIYTSVYEHNAVARTLEKIKKNTNCHIRFLPVDEGLKIDINKTKFLFASEHPDVIVMSAVSNVTGYILPAKEVFSLGKEYDAITIVDAAQAAGLIDINFDDYMADIICFAGHKTLCGPFGVGGFVMRKNLQINKVLTGGTGSDSLNTDMPDRSYERYEAGSKDIVAIAGLNVALSVLDSEKHRKTIYTLTKKLIDGLKNIQNVIVMSSEESAGIISFVVEGFDSNDVGTILDEEFDIAVRTGYHCAPYIHDYIGDKPYNGTIRVGIGPFNTEEDIEALLEAVKSL